MKYTLIHKQDIPLVEVHTFAVSVEINMDGNGAKIAKIFRFNFDKTKAGTLQAPAQDTGNSTRLVPASRWCI